MSIFVRRPPVSNVGNRGSAVLRDVVVACLCHWDCLSTIWAYRRSHLLSGGLRLLTYLDHAEEVVVGS